VVLEHLSLQSGEALLPDTVSERLDVTLEPLNQIILYLLRTQRGRDADVEALPATFRWIKDCLNFNRFPKAVNTMRDVAISPGHDVFVAFLRVDP
jgi:hypothetical protein